MIMGTPDRQLVPTEKKVRTITVDVTIETVHQLTIPVEERDIDSNGDYCGGEDLLLDLIDDELKRPCNMSIGDYNIVDYEIQ